MAPNDVDYKDIQNYLQFYGTTLGFQFWSYLPETLTVSSRGKLSTASIIMKKVNTNQLCFLR